MPDTTYSKLQGFMPFPTRIHLGESPSLYLTNTIKTFAESLIGIFVPIYILTLKNLPIIVQDHFTNGLIWVLTFYFIRSFAVILTIGFETNIIFGKINFKGSILGSNIILALSLLLMSFMDRSFIYFIPAAIASGIAAITYWLPFHIFFVRKTSGTGHYGKNFGTRFLLDKLASAAGPILGGLFITLFGFSPLFIIGIVLILVSAFPIMVGVHEHKHGKHNAHHIFKNFFYNRKYRNDTISLISVAADGILYGIFWPILLFTVIITYAKLGLITSISVGLSAFAALYVGKLIDKHGTKTIHKIGVIINSLLYIPRVFVINPIYLYAIDITDKMNGTLFAVPFNALFYKHAKHQHNDSDFVIYREIIVHSSVCFIMLIGIWLMAILPSWKYIFILIAIVSPFSYFINIKNKR